MRPTGRKVFIQSLDSIRAGGLRGVGAECRALRVATPMPRAATDEVSACLDCSPLHIHVWPLLDCSRRLLGAVVASNHGKSDVRADRHPGNVHRLLKLEVLPPNLESILASKATG
eukprot:12942361-Alexandrium_andersonii.AAC.1